MKVMHILCGLTAITAFCAAQAQDRAMLLYRSQPFTWQKSTEPTFLARLKVGFTNWWNTPRTQRTTKPFLTQENLFLKQLDAAAEERDKAFEALKNIKRPGYKLQYSEILNKKNDFFNKQKQYENLGKKFYDLKFEELFKPKKEGIS